MNQINEKTISRMLKRIEMEGAFLGVIQTVENIVVDQEDQVGSKLEEPKWWEQMPDSIKAVLWELTYVFLRTFH